MLSVSVLLLQYVPKKSTEYYLAGKPEKHGEAEPFIMDSGQCTSCAFAVMGYSDSYCDDAIALSTNRHSESSSETSIVS